MISSPEPAKRARQPNEFLIVIVLLIAAWEVLGRVLHLRPDVLPTPSRIVLEASREPAVLLKNALASLTALARGMGAALAFALAVAISGGSFGRYRGAVARVLAAAQATPFLAAVPILVVWFGFGSTPEVLVIFLVAFPVIAAGVLRGLQSIPPEILDFTRSMHASRVDVALKVQLPWVFPSLLGALKTAVTMSVAAATASEFVLAEVGLGAVMIGAVSSLNTPLLLAAFVCVTAIAAILIGIVGLIERVWIARGNGTTG